MPNTSLNTNVQVGTGTIISDTNIVHAEINRLSRDTGWRDIRGLLVNGFTADTARVRRQDDMATFLFTNLDNGGGANRFLAIGSGEDELSNRLTPIGTQWRSPNFVGTGVDCFFTTSANAFNLFRREGTGTGEFLLTFTVPTRPEWPSFLPPAV